MSPAVKTWSDENEPLFLGYPSMYGVYREEKNGMLLANRGRTKLKFVVSVSVCYIPFARGFISNIPFARGFISNLLS